MVGDERKFIQGVYSHYKEEDDNGRLSKTLSAQDIMSVDTRCKNNSWQDGNKKMISSHQKGGGSQFSLYQDTEPNRISTRGDKFLEKANDPFLLPCFNRINSRDTRTNHFHVHENVKASFAALNDYDSKAKKNSETRYKTSNNLAPWMDFEFEEEPASDTSCDIPKNYSKEGFPFKSWKLF